jgi:cold shock protein
MPLGKVKWFNNAKGYGFIIADDSEQDKLLKEDLFAHFSSIQMEGYKTLKAGQMVSFDAQPSGKGYHAINIVPVDSASQRDAPQEKVDEKKAEADKVEKVAVTA